MFRFIPVIIAYIFVNEYALTKKISFGLFFSIGLVLIIVFPLGGAARNFIAATYLFLLFPIFRKAQYHNILLLIMFVGLLIIFPTLNQYRNSSFETVDFKVYFGDFDSADYDAYQMMLNCIKYFENEGFILTQVVSGILLFYIPRSIWPNKPLSSGILIGDYFQTRGINNELFNNLSTPILGEFYLDFGISGIVLASVVLFLLFYILTKKYNKSNRWQCVYAIVFSYIFYVSRGALMSTFPKCVGALLGFFFIDFIIFMLRIEKERRSYKFI